MRKKIYFLSVSGMIAALYVLLTLLSSVFGLASGILQFRLAEALCVLPCFTPAAIPGLFIGCFLANLFTGVPVFDVILGSFATLLGAYGSYALRKYPLLSIMPPVLANALVIPVIAIVAYGMQASLPLITVVAGSVLLSELVSCGVLGGVLQQLLRKYRSYLFFM